MCVGLQWIPLGPMVCGIPSIVIWPLLLRVTLLRTMPVSAENERTLKPCHPYRSYGGG